MLSLLAFAHHSSSVNWNSMNHLGHRWKWSLTQEFIQGEAEINPGQVKSLLHIFGLHMQQMLDIEWSQVLNQEPSCCEVTLLITTRCYRIANDFPCWQVQAFFISLSHHHWWHFVIPFIGLNPPLSSLCWRFEMIFGCTSWDTVCPGHLKLMQMALMRWEKHR